MVDSNDYAQVSRALDPFFALASEQVLIPTLSTTAGAVIVTEWTPPGAALRLRDRLTRYWS
jgi:hypothetical protein